MTRTTMVLALAAIALSPHLARGEMETRTATSQAVRASDARIAQLHDRSRALTWESSKTKGAISQVLQLERLRVERLIDDLESGRAVAPSDIEALGR